MNIVAEVVIENASPAFDKAYSYLVPKLLEATALAGTRVRIPFGRGNTKKTGFILETKKTDEVKGFKEILEVIDNPPLISEEGIWIIKYLKETTFCSWFDAVRLLIPTGLGISPKISFRLGEGKARSFNDKELEILNYLAKKKNGISEETFYKTLEITEDEDNLKVLLNDGNVIKSQELRQKILDDKITMVQVIETKAGSLTKRQTEVLDFLNAEAPISLKEAIYYTGATRSVLDKLKDKGMLEYYEVIRSRGEFVNAVADNDLNVELSDSQKKVYNYIKADLGKYSTQLLHGITGSGKTQVFLKLVEDVVQNGKNAIVMVPEISLTSQTVVSLQERFGNKVAVLHSGLSLGERTDEWKRIKDGKAEIVVGTRSAVFAPMENIGIVIIDEEQEHTYKSDKSPRFHTRDIAIARMKYHKGMLLLCSATPSVESYYYAKTGKYTLHNLADRYGEAELPEVRIVDMSENSNLSASLSLSQVLLEEVYYNLEHNEQSILLLNRRGYSTVVKCSSCGETMECPNCSVPMTYHSANNSLICHYCGYIRKPSDKCEHCGSEFIKYSGIGTQKLEEELKGLFPNARILRMDMDTTMARDSHRDMFDSFRKQEYDILIGTQMVAKGLNFPKVTLVGVISADQSLFSDDFRSYERSFSLFTQVVGRSGRGDEPGRALIQTYSPDHPIIELASKQDYPDFYKDEILTRKLHLYPPFCTLAGFGFVGKNHDKVSSWAIKFMEEFKKLAQKEYSKLPLRILGPTQGEVLKVAEKYRYKLVIKCRNDKATRDFFWRMLDWFYSNCKDVSIFIDMYYERM